MNNHWTHRLLLALHIGGIVMMAGTTLIDYLTFNTFWQLADAGDARALGLVPLMARYGLFIRAGAATILLTGLVLLLISRGVSWAQPWFRAKLGLVAVLVLHGILVGNKQGHLLREIVMTHAPDFLAFTADVRSNMNFFYPLQLALFFLTIVASISRPVLVRERPVVAKSL